MTGDEDRSNDHLTFSRRYGYADLPEPMRLEYIPQKFKQAIYLYINEAISIDARFRSSESVGEIFFREPNLGMIIVDYHYDILEMYYDEVTDFSPEMVRNFFKDFVEEKKWHEVLTMVEFILRHQHCSESLHKRLIDAFNETPISYFVDESGGCPTIFPRISRESGEATRKAMQVVQDNGMDGAATHLREAAKHINAGQYADSIADSIHAVESVARTICPESKTLGPALKSLEKAQILKHPALKQAFEKLYEYTNREQGIRHALLEKDAADVGLDEAIFMFGACASFAAYLTQKHRQQAGERESSSV